MSTAHRPTFDPARGKAINTGPAYHQRLLPAHTKLKIRQPGQGGAADTEKRDLRAELLKAEAAHFAKTRGEKPPEDDEKDKAQASPGTKRLTDERDEDMGGKDEEEESPEAKRRRILEETRDIDADSESDSDESSEDDSDDDDEEDETAELLRELEKIKRERAEQKEREERERKAAEEDRKMVDIARGNPLLNGADFTVKRRWDDDVIFKNQARGTDDKKKPEFINDVLRSDFHKKFMSKYVR